MVVIVVMQEHLPSIRQLCIARLSIAYGRREVDRSWVERRIEGAIHWAGHRHVRRRVVCRHDQRRLRGQLPLSVTVSVTTYSVGTPGGAEKVCAGFACVLTGEPSPKFHE